jgi:hypothetical protein
VIRAIAAFLFLAAAPASLAVAQSGGGEWIEYRNLPDRFKVNLPGQPTVRETMYEPQRGGKVPTRIYSAQDGPRRYSVTVVDLTSFREPSDVKGSIAWEAWNFRKRGGKVIYDAYSQIDRIEGHHIHIANADGSLTYAGIYLESRHLYILEATVPASSPGGAMLFQQSIQILDETGVRIRYELDIDGNKIRRVK